MRKNLICFFLAIMLLLSALTGADGGFSSADGVVTVAKANGVYTVTVADPYFADAQITIAAIVRGEPVSVLETDPGKVAFVGEQVADETGKTVFRFIPKEIAGLEKGLYIAVSSDLPLDCDGLPYFTAAASCNVTINCGENGSADPAGPIAVTEGDSVTITFTPDQGYEIDQVTVDDVPTVHQDGRVTTTVLADTAIAATFKKIETAPSIPQTYNNVFTSTSPVEINGETINEPMGIVFAKVTDTPGYELIDYGMEFAIDRATLEAGNGKAYPALRSKSQMGNFGICFYGAFEKGATYYARPYAIYIKDDVPYKVTGNILSFVPNP